MPVDLLANPPKRKREPRDLLARQPHHRDFDGSNIPGYNPETGMVEDTAPEASMPRTMAGVMGAIEGLPVVGPYARQGVEATSAGLASLITGEPFSEVRSEMRDMADDAMAQHPLISKVSGIGGALAGTVPMVLAAPAAFGAGAGGLVARSAASAASGSALGGADAAVRSGGDADAMKSGTLWGGGLGLLGPGVGQLVGKGVSAVANRVRGPSQAERSFARAVGADAVDDIPGRLSAMGDEAMPMDLGPNLQQQAGGIAATPGRGQEIIRSAVASRDAGANQRIMGAVDETLGPAPVPSRVEASIQANKQAVSPLYEEALSGARRVDTEPIANNLDAMAVRLRGNAQKAVKRVRDMLNVTGTDQLDPNPRTLLETRNAIDGMMETADSKTINALKVARQQIDNELQQKVPGIKAVDAKWHELSRQEKALGRGQQVLDSGRTAPRPSELADEVRQGAIPAGEMVGPSAAPFRLREGARAEIDRIIGTNANDRVALQRIIKGEGDWNRSRLATLFGEEKADKIINVLDRERAFADTSNVVTRNSMTASRQAAQQETAAEAGNPGFFRSALNMRLGDAVANVGDRALGGARSSALQRTNEELAQLLTSRDPGTLRAAIRAVTSAQKRGDISAQKARELTNSLLIGASQRRQPLEITVTP